MYMYLVAVHTVTQISLSTCFVGNGSICIPQACGCMAAHVGCKMTRLPKVPTCQWRPAADGDLWDSWRCCDCGAS